MKLTPDLKLKQKHQSNGQLQMKELLADRQVLCYHQIGLQILELVWQHHGRLPWNYSQIEDEL